MRGVRLQGQTGGLPRPGPALEQPHLAAACLTQVLGRGTRQDRLVRNQDHRLGDGGQAGTNRPHRPGDVRLAIRRRGAQVQQCKLPTLQASCQFGHRDGLKRRQACRGVRRSRRTNGFSGAQDHRLVPELAQPVRRERGAHALAIDQDHACATHAHPLVGGLHQLPARRMHRPLQVACRVLLGSAHIEQVGGACTIVQPGLRLRGIEHRDAVAHGELATLRLQRCERRALRRRRVGTIGAMFKG